MAIKTQITKTPAKYIQALDKPTRERIAEKLQAIAANPTDSRHSKPLEQSIKRSARVGKYRILFTWEEEIELVTVTDIDSRGQVYRNA